MNIPDNWFALRLPPLKLFIAAEIHSWYFTPSGEEKTNGVCVMNSMGFARKFQCTDGGVRKVLIELQRDGFIEEFTSEFCGRQMRALRLRYDRFPRNGSVSPETVNVSPETEVFPQKRISRNGSVSPETVSVSPETVSVSPETHTLSYTLSITPEEELLGSNSVRAHEEKTSLPAKPSSPTPSSAQPPGDCAAIASNVAPSDDLYPSYKQGGRVYTMTDVALTLALSGVPESFVQAAWSHYDAKGWLLSEGVHVANPVSQIRIAWLKPAVKAAIMGEPQSRDAPYSTSYNAQRTPSGTGTQRLPTVQAPANFNQHPVKARVHHVS